MVSNLGRIADYLRYWDSSPGGEIGIHACLRSRSFRGWRLSPLPGTKNGAHAQVKKLGFLDLNQIREHLNDRDNRPCTKDNHQPNETP